MFIYILLLGLLLFSFVRCIVFNPHFIIYYTVRDIWDFFLYKKWRIWNGYGLNIYIGLFGHGKTLSAVHEIYRVAKRYPYVHILTNVPLPALDQERVEMLTSYKQIVDCQENTLIFIDEISTLFNSRAYKDFPMDLLFQVLQCRKNRKQLIATAQRFGHVDKLMRDITDYVIDTNKYWRLQSNKFYDAWDYENAMNRDLIKCKKSRWWFVRNKDYEHYDTRQLILKDEFISNAEVLAKRCPTTDIFNANLTRKGKKIVNG